MAGVKQFDVDEALDLMLELFWQRGYRATTTRELAGSANLSESSLFNTFGSKQAIYLKVLQRYIDRNTHLLMLIENNPSPLEGLREYWEKIASIAADRKRTRGCMITNAATAEAGDESIAAFIRASYKRSEKVFRKALDRAVELGELQPDTDTEALAEFLLHSTQGIRVMSRLNPSRKKMMNIVEGVMCAINLHRTAPH
ncbi:MAG: TetR/AcrR family transcriptional regulator [Gammaproteobacteria bacterium]|nr:TetR/AcrR family transcriptional regulator [Pseudomonadales bacterium]MCP5347208.1 TetR/AcrR family transcriptional regulator [Pseudomonadales bacterium]